MYFNVMRGNSVTFRQRTDILLNSRLSADVGNKLFFSDTEYDVAE